MPNKAVIQHVGRMGTVRVVNSKNEVEDRPVSFRDMNDVPLVVRDGLGPEDWLILEGAGAGVRPGMTVRPKRVSPTDSLDK